MNPIENQSKDRSVNLMVAMAVGLVCTLASILCDMYLWPYLRDIQTPDFTLVRPTKYVLVAVVCLVSAYWQLATKKLEK